MHLTQLETVQVHSGVRGTLVDATKQVLIESLPPILVVHVKRFLYDLHGGVQKSNKPLLYNTILEVPRGIPYFADVQTSLTAIPVDVLSPNQRGASSPRYRLYAGTYWDTKPRDLTLTRGLSSDLSPRQVCFRRTLHNRLTAPGSL